MRRSMYVSGGSVSGSASGAAIAVSVGAGTVVSNATTLSVVTSSTVGQVLRVTAANTFAYGALNLSLAAAVTGTLPAGNQAAQTMSGDVIGTTAASVVSTITGTAGVVTVATSTAFNVASGTHSLTIGGVAKLTVGTTFLTVGATASAAAAGLIRLPTTATLLSTLKADGTTDMPILVTDSSNNLTIGTASATTSPTNITADILTGGGFFVRVNGSGNIVLAASGTGTVPIIKIGNSNLAATGTLRTQFDYSWKRLTVGGSNTGAVFAINGSSDDFVWGDVNCTSQTWNSATTTGTHTWQVGGVVCAAIGLTYLSVGAANLSTVADIRLGPHTARTFVGGQNAATGTNVPYISGTATNNLFFGDTGSVSACFFNTAGGTSWTARAGSTALWTASTTTVTWTSPAHSWAKAGTPSFTHAAQTTDTPTFNWTWTAQNATTGTATGVNANGAQIIIQGGAAKTDGTTGLRKGIRHDFSNGSLGGLEMTEVTAGQRIVAINRMAALTTTECPTGAGDGVMYIGNAVTLPTVASVSGCYAYSNVGPYAMHTTGQHQSMTPKYGTRAWPSDANYTAVVADYTNTMLNMTGGLLSTTRDLIVPLIAGYVWTIINNTTGSVTPQSIRVIGASGTGVTILTGTTGIIYCDGTNIVRASPV